MTEHSTKIYLLPSSVLNTFVKRTPERKDRIEDSHGGVLIYVKEGLHYKPREDLEIRGIECIWIEVANNNKRILFGLFYRPPNSNASYFSDIEDSNALAVDMGISDIIITGDLNVNFLTPQIRRKIDSLCTQFMLYQSVSQSVSQSTLSVAWPTGVQLLVFFCFAQVFQWCCSTPQRSPGIGRNTFLSSPHLCFIIVFNGDLFVSRDDPLMS